MVVPQTAEIKTVPVCNRSIHCNTEHEARRRKTDATLPVLRDPSSTTQNQKLSSEFHTLTLPTPHTRLRHHSPYHSPLFRYPNQAPHGQGRTVGPWRDGPRSGRGCLDSAYAHTHTHSLTHRALASDCAIWASRELYTKTITRSLSSVVCTFRTAL